VGDQRYAPGVKTGTHRTGGWVDLGTGLDEDRHVKDNVYPRTSHEGAKGESMYRSARSSTPSIHGVAGQHHAPATLHQDRRLGTHGTRDWVGPRAGHRLT
jgi:hypothetical protein